VIPSLSYVISRDWNASLAVEFLGRWYDADSLGFSRRDLEMLPIWTLEYVIPVSLFGGDKIANAFGRPALDFQGSYLKAWSNAPGLPTDRGRASCWAHCPPRSLLSSTSLNLLESPVGEHGAPRGVIRPHWSGPTWGMSLWHQGGLQWL